MVRKYLGIEVYVVKGMVLFFSFARFIFSQGLAVSPGGILIQGVLPGKTYDIYKETGIKLTIYNKDNSPHTYILSTHKPSEVGNKRWEKGYFEIPDPSWCWFDKKEVKIEGNKSESVNIYIKIPDEERYYNQHWIVTVGVLSKPEYGLSLGVYVRMQIETAVKENPEIKPDGKIGFVPATLTFNNKFSQKILTMYNNTEKRLSFNVFTIEEEKNIEKKTYLTPNYSFLEKTWFKIEKRNFEIEPMGKCKIRVSVNIPENCEKNRLENILFFRSDEEISGFVRVRYEKNN